MNKLALKSKSRGFTLLLSILVSGIVLAIGLSILSIALKQFKISSIGFDSEVAFHAAYAGVECAQYWDTSSQNGNKFDVPPNGRQPDPAIIDCMGLTREEENRAGQGTGQRSGDEQEFEFDWTTASGDERCTKFILWKYYDDDTVGPVGDDMFDALGYNLICPEGVECTVVRSRGYNRACGDISSLRTVEREIFVRY